MLGVTLKLTSSLQCISKLQNVEQKYYGLREARKTDGDQIANAWLISPNNSSSFPESMLVSIRTFLVRKEAVIITCLDQVKIITRPKLEVKCNQDIDYCEINISPTNSLYIDPDCSSLRERRI